MTDQAHVVVAARHPIRAESVVRRVRLMLDRLAARGHDRPRVIVWRTGDTVVAATTWIDAAFDALAEGRIIGVYDSSADDQWIIEDVHHAER